MASEIGKQSGKGLSYGVVSELATYWHVLSGHEEELRAATERFANVLDAVPREVNIHTGLRDSRHVIFDDGQRLMWATTFENEWDPYVDDFIQIGLEHFLDWMLHTVEGSNVEAWAEASGGVDKFNVRAMEDPDVEAQVKRSTGGLKAILQSVQSPGTGYFNNLGSWTMPQIEKAHRLQEAFEQVLDTPGAEEALQHPALKPLLEQAAD